MTEFTTALQSGSWKMFPRWYMTLPVATSITGVTLSHSCLVPPGSLIPWLPCSPGFTWSLSRGLNQCAKFSVISLNSAATWQQDLGISSETMRQPLVKMTNMSSDKSYSILVRSEMSTCAVLNAAYSSLWSATVSIQEIQPSCFFHITFLEKINCLFIWYKRDSTSNETLFVFMAKGCGIIKTMFTDLLIKVRHGLQLPGHVCWDQPEKSAWVSLCPAASPLGSTGTTISSHCLQPRAQIAGQESTARSPLVWEDLD